MVTVVTALIILPAHHNHMNGMDSATSPAPGASAAPETASQLRYEQVMTAPQRVRQGLEKDERLTPDQARVLRWLAERSPRSQTELMHETGFNKHKTSTLIRRLRRLKLIKWAADHQDSRRHNIQIKQAGRDLLRKIDEVASQQLAQLPKPAISEAPPSEVAASVTPAYRQEDGTNPLKTAE